MIFGATIFLTGLLAVGLPVAIHLLARQRTRVLPWGAMEFLRQSTSSATARRKRLRDLLLLLLRALAIACVVLAFAQPYLSHRFFAGRDRETVFVWDVSFSTLALDESGEPIQAAMRTKLWEELERLPNRSSVRILLAGANPTWLKPDWMTLSEINRQALRQAIDEHAVQAGESRLADAVLRALAVESDETRRSRFREVVVIHDFQRQAWQQEDQERWKVIQDSLAQDPNRSLRGLSPGVELASDLPQALVTDLKVSRDTVAPEAPARLTATIRNASRQHAALGDVIWRIDGREVERLDTIELAAGTESKVEQTLRFESLGCHLVECVFAADRDLLPLDNRCECVVSTKEALPILMIDDTERSQRGQILPSEFLIASLGGSLNPPTGADSRAAAQPTKQDSEHPGLASLFAPRVLRSDAWREEALEDVLAVFIVSADALPDSAIESLRRFVREGRGLWLVLDPRQDSLRPWEVKLLNRLGLDALTATRSSLAPANRPYNLKPADPASTFAAQMVAQNLDLHRAEIRAVQKLENPLVLNEERLLNTIEGEPVLLSMSVGAGRVLVQTTDMERRSTNLPILQSFVPLVREIAWETAGKSLPLRNLDPGGAIRISATELQHLLGAPTLDFPDGNSQAMRFLGSHYQSTETLLPGVYRIFDGQTGDLDEAKELFSVRRPAAESDLGRLEAEALAALLAPASTPAEGLGNQPRGAAPFAFWLALIAGLLFLAEALLARWIVRDRAQRAARIDLKPVF